MTEKYTVERLHIKLRYFVDQETLIVFILNVSRQVVDKDVIQSYIIQQFTLGICI